MGDSVLVLRIPERLAGRLDAAATAGAVSKQTLVEEILDDVLGEAATAVIPRRIDPRWRRERRPRKPSTPAEGES